jgi:hypothetical protein
MSKRRNEPKLASFLLLLLLVAGFFYGGTHDWPVVRPAYDGVMQGV